VLGADLVVLCVPVGAMGAIAAEIGPHLAPGATVTDVGSVKQAVIEAVAPHLPPGVPLCLVIRWRELNTPARVPALPHCSRTAGAC
jgi:prephenate dehydrogenase